MKHALWLTVGLWALLLGSCSKDNPTPNPDPTCPITALQLPASDAETPILAGNTVTIQGQGFTANDQIWLRPNPTEKAAGDIQATDVQVVDQGISFTAPALDGPHTVLLVRRSDEYALGSLYFSTSSSESTPVRLIATGLREPDYQLTFYEIDPTSGQTTTLCSIPGTEDYDFESPLQLPGLSSLYGILSDRQGNAMLSRFDLSDNHFSILDTLTRNSLGVSLGLINQEVHALIQTDARRMQLVKIDPTTGALSLVCEIDQIDTPEGELYLPKQPFLYDASLQQLYTALYIYPAGQLDQAYPLRVDLQTQSAAVLSLQGSETLYFLQSAAQCLQINSEATTQTSTGYRTHVNTFDPVSGLPSTPIFILENIFEACSYDVQNDRLYYLTYPHQSTDDQVYEKETMSIFDLSVGKTTILKNPISETLSTLLVMQP